MIPAICLFSSIAERQCSKFSYCYALTMDRRPASNRAVSFDVPLTKVLQKGSMFNESWINGRIKITTSSRLWNAS